MAFMKMLWASGSPIPLSGSWDYWTSVQKTIVEIRRREDDDVVDTIYKANKKIAYYAMVNCEDSYTLIIISPIDDAVDYIESGVRKTYRGTVTDVNRITWYWSGFQFLENRSDYYVYPDCVMGDTVYSVNDGAQAAQDLLDRIYAVPFWNNYEVGQTYSFDFANSTDVQKTIRKALGIYLFKNIGLYGNNAAYTQLSNNADTFISEIMTVVGDKKFIQIDSIACDSDGSGVTLWFDYNYNNSALNTKNLNLVRSDDNYGFKVFVGGSVAREDILWAYTFARVRIESDGTISSSRGFTGDLSTFVIGIGLSDASSGSVVGNNITISNIGIDL